MLLYDLIEVINDQGLDYLLNFIDNEVGLLRLDHQTGTAWLINHLRTECRE